MSRLPAIDHPASPSQCYKSWEFRPEWEISHSACVPGIGHQGCAWRDQTAPAPAPGAPEPYTTSHKCWRVDSQSFLDTQINNGQQLQPGLAFTASTEEWGIFCSNNSLSQSTRAGKCPNDQVHKFIRVNFMLSAAQTTDMLDAKARGELDRASVYRPPCMCNNTWINYQGYPTSPPALEASTVNVLCYTNYGAKRVQCADPPFNDDSTLDDSTLSERYGNLVDATGYQLWLSNDVNSGPMEVLEHAKQHLTHNGFLQTKQSMTLVCSLLLVAAVAVIFTVWNRSKSTEEPNQSKQLLLDEYVEMLEEVSYTE